MRFVGNLTDAYASEIYIGMPMEVSFEDYDAISFHQWHRADC